MQQGFSQSQNQTQKQILSQAMIQSINLLADNTDSLRDKIYAEVERNPALEIINDEGKILSDKRKNARIDTTFETTKFGSSEKSDAFQSFLESSPDSETLQQHLLRQLNFLHLTEEENEAGQLIIQNLDKNGYHIVALESLFPTEEKYAVAKKVLKLIHEFEPVGVACRDLRESLFIQAYEEDADDFTLDFIKNHFDLLQNPRPQVIQKKLSDCGQKATVEEIEELISFIRTLDPYPAREYESVQTVFISPDVNVERKIDEETGEKSQDFIISLVKTNLPEVVLNKEMLEYQNSNEQIKKAVNEANQFLNSLEMRSQTLEKVASRLVIEQKEFFLKGPLYLKPLRMLDIAEKVGVHESTVSRIANEKYLHCDWGLFEFKYFFSNAVNVSEDSSEGQTLSKEAIKQTLAKIIRENEEKGGKPLSDQKLSDALAEKGINIARRTVAKYRGELNLNSSYDR